MLHGLAIVALVMRLDRSPPREEFLPPAAVSMVFEGARPERPGAEETSPEALPVPPAAFPGTPGETPPVPSGVPVMPTISSPPAEAPAQPAPPVTEPEPRPEPVPPAEVEQGRPTEVEQVRPEEAEQVRPPQVEPAPPAPRQVQTFPPRTRPIPAPRPPDFPAPTNFSLVPPAAAPGAPIPVKPVIALGMAPRDPGDSSPFSVETDAEVGPDWRNALIGWVTEHAYYPSQAAALGQQGNVRVLVTADPDGRVLSVEIEQRSGSPWLDLALAGMFRGARLPPMPKQAGEQPVPFHFTMHYMLVR